MSSYTVKVDKAACIGAGKCVATAPEAFGFDADETSRPLVSLASVADPLILKAARMCPVTAIAVFDAQGEEVFPRDE